MKDSLRLVFWELTAKCNLKCCHCRAEAQDEVVAGELSTEKILEVARSIRATGDPIMILTGGEPLLRRDLEPLIAGLSPEVEGRVHLSTNGLLLARRARGLRDAGLDAPVRVVSERE